MASLDRIKEILQSENSGTNNAIQFIDDKIVITLSKDNAWEKVDAEVPLNGGPYAATVRLGTFFGTFETQVSRCFYENSSTTGESSKENDSGVGGSREEHSLSSRMKREDICDYGYASSTAPSLGGNSSDNGRTPVDEPRKGYQQYYKNLDTNFETLRKKRSASMDCLAVRDPGCLPSERNLMLKRTIDAAPTGGMLNHWFEDGMDAIQDSRPYLKGSKPSGRYDTLSSAWTGRMSKVSAGDYLKSAKYSSQISLVSKTKHNNNLPFSYHKSNKENLGRGYDLFYPRPLESQVSVEPPARKDKCLIM